MAHPLDPKDDMQHTVMRKREAAARRGHAFQRLLQRAETRDSGQARRVALFIAATCNGESFPFDLFELRAVDEAIGDDITSCVDALRWGRGDLHRLVPDGDPAGEGGHQSVGPAMARAAVIAGGVGD